MIDGIRLQNRDIELLTFLGRYKIISLDNTRYIYETVTYQEKRIVILVKHNYIRRLKHRYITLGTKGKEYLLENGFEVRNHCRNENNIERLNVISDIASCLIQDNFNFIPSWNMKKEDEATTHSRRYIGKLEYNNQDEFLVNAIYDGKKDKYIKSLEKTAEGIKDKVIFTGYINHNELYKIYSIADVQIVPSRFEDPCPLAVIEGVVSGKPLIVSNCGGIPKIVSEDNAVFIENNEKFIENLKKLMIYMYNNEEKMKKMSKYSKEQIGRFSLKIYYENLINELSEE